MINKKVIRRPSKAGEFTTIPHSILYDIRLSALELRILLSILADADNFNLTHKLIINRFKLDKKTVQKAFKALEDYGYIRRTSLKRGHFYTISEYGNLANNNGTVEAPIPSTPIAEPQETIELADYNDLILSLLPSYATDDDVNNLMEHLVDSVSDGIITKNEQLSTENLTKIISSIIPKPSDAKIKSYITEICETYAGGKQITSANKKEITKKVLKYFADNKDIEPTEKAIRSRILMYKSSYTNHGILDQRYQN